MTRRLLLAAAFACQLPAAAAAQDAGGAHRLTLAEALRRADRAAYANRGARAAAEAQQAASRAALRGVLPSLSADASLVHTTDPINAFGFSLKQRGVSMASFNPATLNDPAAIANYSSGVTLQQPLLNSDAWAGVRAARAAAGAADAQATWTRVATSAGVIQAFYGAVLAKELATTMLAAERSAREHVRAAEVAAANGLVTGSDGMLARVRAGEVEAQRIEAESRAALARQQLAVLLGTPGDTAFILPDSLPAGVVADRAHSPDAARADVEAAARASEAARFNRQRASATMLPRLNGFARYEWNSPTSVARGKPMWTAGAIANWSLFGGGAELADLQGAAARERAAQAQLDGVRAAAELEQREASEAWRVASARAAIADTAAQQSDGALRIVRRKYEGGLAAITELLDAAAANTMAHLMRSDARFKLIAAAAAQIKARGGNPADLAVLDNDSR